MRVLALGPESFGGFAGMAQGTRDYLRGLLSAPEVESVDLLCRRPPNQDLPLPEGLHETVLEGNPARFVVGAARAALSQRYDLIFCLHLRLMPVASVLKRAFGLPVWLHVHGMDGWGPTGAMSHGSSARADLVTSSSRYTLERFLSWASVDEARTAVLNNPFHPDRLGPGPKPEYLLERYGLHGKRVLLTVGRMLGVDRFKGHDEILYALPQLARRHPQVSWLVVGDGPDQERIRGLVDASEVSERVVFAGRIREIEKRDHYLVADAFALPSTTEGFGIVYLEAAACGLPVLGGDRDGARDPLCDGRLGILVDPHDERQLLAGLDELLRRPRGVPDELATFTFERHAERMRELVARCFGGLGKGKRAA
ncbi:MAG: glycosyltransferase family 4 protein [Planctomycetota bacterium]